MKQNMNWNFENFPLGFPYLILWLIRKSVASEEGVVSQDIVCTFPQLYCSSWRTAQHMSLTSRSSALIKILSASVSEVRVLGYGAINTELTPCVPDVLNGSPDEHI